MFKVESGRIIDRDLLGLTCTQRKKNRDQGELKIYAAVRKEWSGEKVLAGWPTYCMLSPFIQHASVDKLFRVVVQICGVWMRWHWCRVVGWP